MTAFSRELIDKAIKCLETPIPPDQVNKAWTQPGAANAGVQDYYLDPELLRAVPVHTPLRDQIARQAGGHNIQAEFEIVNGVNTANILPGVSQGNRGAVISTSLARVNNQFRGLGLEDFVTFEADYAAKEFADIKAVAALGLLQSLMIGEENTILGGRGTATNALGVTPAPTLTVSAAGGTLAAGTLSVIAVALSYDAYWALAGLNNGAAGQSLVLATAQVPAQVVRTNIDSSTDTFGGGSSQKSANVTATVVAGGSVVASIANPVLGAAGYAWFWGVAGSEVLGAVTTVSAVSITAPAGGTQTAASLPAADNSVNNLVFDGIIAQLCNSSSGAIVRSQPLTNGLGTPLTADGATGIVEIDNLLLAMWNQYRLAPDYMFLNAQEQMNISRKLMASSAGSGVMRVAIDKDEAEDGVSGGFVAVDYVAKALNKKVRMIVHPTMPPGTILFWTETLPYKLSNMPNVIQMRLRQEILAREWPVVKRRYEYGVYMDGALQIKFPGAFALLTNIGNG